MKAFTCPSCGKLWPENYCPECACTIDRSLLPSAPASTAVAPATFGGIATGAARKSTRGLMVREALSWLVYCLALCLVPIVLYLAYWAFEVVDTRDAIGYALFIMEFAPTLLAISVLFVMIPSLVLYRRSRARRDIQGFWISVASSVAVVAEVVIMMALLNGKRLYGPAG